MNILKNKQIREEAYENISRVCYGSESDWITNKFLIPYFEETLSEIITQQEDYKEILEYVFIKLDNNAKDNFLKYMISSDLNCFTGWFLNIINIVREENEDYVISNFVNDFYKMNKKYFDLIGKGITIKEIIKDWEKLGYKYIKESTPNNYEFQKENISLIIKITPFDIFYYQLIPCWGEEYKIKEKDKFEKEERRLVFIETLKYEKK